MDMDTPSEPAEGGDCSDGRGSARSVSSFTAQVAEDDIAPCKICGRIFPTMPKKSLYCWVHKRTVDTMVAQAKEQDKAASAGVKLEPGTKCLTPAMDKFNELKNKSGAPPSPFSNAVMEFERTCPAGGRGKKRTTCDLATLMETHSVSTEMKRGFKLVYMHKAQWLQHGVVHMAMTAGDAEEEWLRVDSVAKEDERDMKGPRSAPMRLAMHTQDFVTGSNSVAHT